MLTGVTGGSAKGYFFPNGFHYFNGSHRPAAVQTLLSVRSESGLGLTLNTAQVSMQKLSNWSTLLLAFGLAIVK